MSTLTLWGPRPVFARRAFTDFDTTFDSLVRRAFGTTTPAGFDTSFVPAAEIARDGEDALVRVELPGVDAAKDVSVEVTGRQLVIKGERRDERSSESDGRSLREVRYGSFSRSFTLPKGVTGDAVSASYDAGVLNVRITGVYTQPAVPQAHRVEITTATPQPEIDSTEPAEQQS
jgi:HSP20 family molecular chaperone IbpA